jgi:hypothetical protein
MLYNVYIVLKRKSPVLIVLRREEYLVTHYVMWSLHVLQYITTRTQSCSPTQYSRKSYKKVLLPFQGRK